MLVLVAKSSPTLATPWIVAWQAPLSMGLPRQEYWSGLPLPLPGDLPNLGIEPTSLGSPALAGGFFTTVLPGKPKNVYRNMKIPNIQQGKIHNM